MAVVGVSVIPSTDVSVSMMNSAFVLAFGRVALRLSGCVGF